MSEEKVEVKTYKTYLRCDSICCRCIMEFTGVVYATNPVSYQHKCPCGHTKTTSKKYPHITYEEIPTWDDSRDGEMD